MIELLKKIWKCKIKGVHKVDVYTRNCIRCGEHIKRKDESQ